MTHGILAWLVIGAIAGWLAGLIVKGGGFGLVVDIIVGIVGAVIGGWLAGELGSTSPADGSARSSWRRWAP